MEVPSYLLRVREGHASLSSVVGTCVNGWSPHSRQNGDHRPAQDAN